jgi:hypothetical protein
VSPAVFFLALARTVTWVLASMAVGVMLALYFWRFLRDRPAPTRRAVSSSRQRCTWEARWAASLSRGVISNSNWTYALLVAVEETLEMPGVVVFVRALLTYCAGIRRELRFVTDGQAAAVTTCGTCVPRFVSQPGE